jgi:hypothetical protein
MARVRGKKNAKRVQPAKKIERQGIALIGKIVADMGHLWNEPQNDFGIDGSVELVDPKSEKATNRIVLVQSKATSVPFGDRPIGFTCDEDDLRYWLHGNAPVILVRSHPSSGEAYWVSVKDYFRDNPDQRESRRINFDRDEDRFNVESSESLWKLARARADGLHLGTPPVHETLVSNLLSVAGYPSQIFSAKATISHPSEAQEKWAETAGAWPRNWIFWSGRIYSFSDPGSGMLAKIATGPVKTLATSDWAESEDDGERRRFVWLLKGALSDQMRPVLRANNDLTWVAATDDLPLVIPVAATSTSRTLVKAYSGDDGVVRYVRHLAFAPVFTAYGGQWFLEITPSYHFTRDGFTPDGFAAERRSKIKRIERHADFRRNVDTLARLLRGEVDLGGLTPDPEHRLLEFGELASVKLDTGEDQAALDEDLSEALDNESGSIAAEANA